MPDQITDTNETDHDPVTVEGRRRRLFLTGAGIAGAAAIVGSQSASAADNDPVVVSGDFYGGTPTRFTNTDSNSRTPGTPGDEAIVGTIQDAGNRSHAIRGVTGYSD